MRPGLFLAIAIVGAVTGAQAKAAGGRDYEVDYFKEHELKTQVGKFYKPCGTGAAKMDGVRTPYFVKSQSSCSGGGHTPSSSVSCHFTDSGCTDAAARMIQKKPHKPTKAHGKSKMPSKEAASS